MDSAVLAQCVTDVLQPGQTVTPDELVTQITARSSSRPAPVPSSTKPST